MPAFTCSSKFVHVSRNDKCHVMTSNELSFINGYPVFSHLPYHDVLIGKIPANDVHLQRMLLGNGMCLMAEMAWWLYVFAHVVRREVAALQKPILLNASLPQEETDYDDI